MDKRLFLDSIPTGRKEPMSGLPPRSNGAGDHFCVSKAEDAVLIQVVGLGNMFLAPTLQSFVESEIASNFHHFIIDLTHCRGMDSTFMGTFIGLSNLVKKRCGLFCLVNVSEDNHRLLKTLGVLHVVSIHSSPCSLPVEKTSYLYPTNDPYSRMKQIQSAHKLLIETDPRNEDLFGPLIKSLAAEFSGFPIILPPDQYDQTR